MTPIDHTEGAEPRNTADGHGTPSGADDGVRERALGVMLGAAVGDALGAPFEFGPPGQYTARFPTPVHDGTGEMIGGGTFGWAPGEFTDDTQMAVGMALSLVDRHGYDPHDVWRYWRAWATTAADIGNSTRYALGHPDWRTVRHPHPESTAANGALMRAFPLAIALATADDRLARVTVLDQAGLTHPHPAAGWGAWLAVAMMRAGIHGADPFEVLADEIHRVPDSERTRFAEMLAPGWTPDRLTVGNGSVWGCLAEAVWAVRTTDDVADALIAAIDIGGDTDTVACVTGAIAGSVHGVGAIPPRWATAVHGQLDTPTGHRRIDATGLRRLALDLLDLSHGSTPHGHGASPIG